MALFSFIIQTDYKGVSLGLVQDAVVIKEVFLDKHSVSQFLMDHFLLLLHEHDLTWADISYIGVNQGPGPFTTLRAIIATVNGISFAVHVPLIGIDGLSTFLTEHAFQTDLVICLFNAFNQDLYFAVADRQRLLCSGWKSGTGLLEELSFIYPTQSITFIGNGVSLFKKDVQKFFMERAIFPDPLPYFPSLAHIALEAHAQWNQTNQGVKKLIPLYLKSNTYKASCPHV